MTKTKARAMHNPSRSSNPAISDAMRRWWKKRREAGLAPAPKTKPVPRRVAPAPTPVQPSVKEMVEALVTLTRSLQRALNK